MALSVVPANTSVKVFHQIDGTTKSETIPATMWGVVDDDNLLQGNKVYDSIGKAQAVAKGMTI